MARTKCNNVVLDSMWMQKKSIERNRNKYHVLDDDLFAKSKPIFHSVPEEPLDAMSTDVHNLRQSIQS